MNVATRIAPPILPNDSKNAMKITKRVVSPKSTAVYILELRSKVIAEGEKMRPREKAPRMFEMEDPRILPIAREDWLWEIAATTTTSCLSLVWKLH
jgi:hypothetical protein